MFYFIAEWVDMPVDQVDYLICLISLYPLSLILRYLLNYKTTSVFVRNAYCGLFGVLLCVICFQWGTLVLLLFAIVGYCILISIGRDVVQWYTLVYCFVCVSTFHIYRMIVDYGQYTLDLSFPLMVMMQRLTYVGFCYHDGWRKKEELSDDQKNDVINVKPTIMEYFSYVFSYYSVLTGPTCTYNQHNDLMTGKNFEVHLADTPHKLPSNTTVVIKKAVVGVVCLLISLAGGSFDLDKVVLTPSLAFPQRLLYVSILCFILRCKYYFVWMIVESASNVAGLGFNGFDRRIGTPKWDLVTNIDILEYEFGSFYNRFLLFNRLTGLWLKRIIYERFKMQRYLMTFALSAVWHGFYPGYYLFYIVLVTGFAAGKRINRIVSPYTESSLVLQMVYSVASYVARTILFDFIHLSFLFLVHDKIYTAWKFYYFSPFLISLVVILLLPNKRRLKAD